MPVKANMPTMYAANDKTAPGMPDAIMKLATSIMQCSCEATSAAFTLLTVTEASHSVSGSRGTHMEIVNKLFANAGALKALHDILCSDGEPAILPRDVEDMNKVVNALNVILSRIQTTEKAFANHVEESEVQKPERIKANFNPFSLEEKNGVLQMLTGCFNLATRSAIYARLQRLEANKKRTPGEESERLCLNAGVGPLTRNMKFRDIESVNIAHLLSGTKRDFHQQQQTSVENGWSIVCPNPKDYVDQARAIKENIVDTPGTTRESSPEVEISTEEIMKENNRDVKCSKTASVVVPVLSGSASSPTTNSGKAAPPLGSRKKFKLEEGEHLEACVLQPKVMVSKGTTTWSYVIERLSLDQDVLLEHASHQVSSDSVVSGLGRLFPSQIHSIQEHTESLAGALVSLQMGHEVDMVAPMGTMQAHAVIFVIRIPGESKRVQNGPLPYYYEEKVGNDTSRFTTVTFADRHRGQDRSLEEIRLADYQAGRNIPGKAGASPYPWEVQPQVPRSNLGPFSSQNNPNPFGTNPHSQDAFRNGTRSPFQWGRPKTDIPAAAVGKTQAGGFSFGERQPSLFEQPSQTACGLFRQTTSVPQSQNTGNGLFHQNNTTLQGQNGGLFGPNNNSSHTHNCCGLSNQSRNTANPQPGGLFGWGTTPPQSQTTGGLFGQLNNAPRSENSGGLFGPNNTTSQSQNGGGLFGQSNTAQNMTGGGLFGQANPQQQERGIFAQPTQLVPQLPIGGATDDLNNIPKAWRPKLGCTDQNSNVFPAQAGTSIFGHTNNGPRLQTCRTLFGQPANGGNLFGQPRNTSHTTTGNSLFGQPTAAASNQPSLFHQNAQHQAASSAFGQAINATAPSTGNSLFGQPSNSELTQGFLPVSSTSLFANRDSIDVTKPPHVANTSNTFSLANINPTTEDPKSKTVAFTTEEPKSGATPEASTTSPGCGMSAPQSCESIHQSRADTTTQQSRCKTCKEYLTFHLQGEEDRGTCDACDRFLATACWICERKMVELMNKASEDGDDKGKARVGRQHSCW